MIVLLALGFVAAIAQEPAVDDARVRLEQAVRAAIALPDPKERRAAVLEIARQKARSPAELEAVFAAVRPVAVDEPGPHSEKFPLWAAGRLEDVEVNWYVPRGFDATKPAPLLMAFHWTGGTGKQIVPSWARLADELGMVVVAPNEAGKNEGYAFSRREREAAMSCLRWARLRFDVDESRIYFTGVSRGGHLTWDLALRRPDVAAAIAPIIGCPLSGMASEKNNQRFLENVVKLPIRDLQGSQDDPEVLDNLRRAFARLDALHASDARLIEFPDLGHAFRLDAVDWKEFFGKARRELLPHSIALAAADPTEARCAWVEITRMNKTVVALKPRLEINEAAWNKLDLKGQRDLVEGMIHEQTAHLRAVREGSGRLRIASTGVAAIRLHLPAELVDLSKPVVIEWNGKVYEKVAFANGQEMLLEFVERFDRAALSRAVVELP